MRELVKKALLGSRLLRLAADRRGVAILMYHSVMEDPRSQDVFLGGITHPESVFRGQMELLAKQYHSVSLDEVGRFLRGDGALPDRAVAVTFDDGYADNYEIAAPILNRTGVPATFYVTVESVEQRRLPWPARLRFAFRTTKRTSWMHSSGKAWPLSCPRERESAYLFSCGECASTVVQISSSS